jgi:predicted kinase
MFTVAHRQLPDRRTGADAVVVTGVPGAGKTTLGTAIATALDAAFLSLDAIKEDLDARGCGTRGPDHLRRAAESELAARLAAAGGLVVVVDIWIAPARDSERVATLLRQSTRSVVEVLCRVPADVAVERYAGRVRGGPHRPADEDTVRRIREAVAVIAPMGVGPWIEVDTSKTVDLGAVLARVHDSST